MRNHNSNLKGVMSKSMYISHEKLNSNSDSDCPFRLDLGGIARGLLQFPTISNMCGCMRLVVPPKSIKSFFTC